MSDALAIDGVSYRYRGRLALDAVSLTAPRGAFSVLLGPNGAGKTTLFNLATRLFDAPSGRIAICGHDLARTPRKALRALGVVFQARAIDPNLTVGQNLAYQGALYGLDPRTAMRRGRALLDRIGLVDRIGASVAKLSGGEARRVEIIRALLHEPEILLCDQATVGLDVRARAAILKDLRALVEEKGTAVLWATHLLDEVAPTDPVTVLHRGVVRAQARAQDLAGSGTLADAFLALTDETG